MGIVLCAALLLTWICLPRPPLLEGVSFSRQVFDREGRLLRLTLSADGKFRLRTPRAAISPEVIRATEWQEDRYYRFHPGINPVAAVRCAWSFCLGGGHARAGASTISMQLARLRFRLRTRTIHGKLMQMFRALELERHYTKAELLEAYLTLAPYGHNVEGIGAASRLYLDKSPADLRRPEAIALSVIPQSPTRRAPHAGRENAALTAAQDRVYDRLGGAGIAADALNRAYRLVTAPRPFGAPHFTAQVLALPVACDLRTTLDLDLQRLVETAVRRYLAANARRGFVNAAALLVDTRRMEVLAQVGSADFFNAGIDGQVDGTRRPRSPGSALKPFIYALAMDQGLIHPLSLLSDAPHRFGNYDPENFDREFAGPITATDALGRSRNVPAVALAARLRRPTLYGFLRSAGVRLPEAENHYGLALPLGGAEVTAEDLARLYAGLANGGRLQPLRRLLDARDACESSRICSPEAAFLTLDMLGHVPPPGLSEPDPAFPVFWKTGTSHGFRDAWCVGVFDHFVLTMWIGRFDGVGNAGFVGRTAAAPLFFTVVDALRTAGIAHANTHEPPPGSNLRRVELCAVSGQLPTAACRHRTQGWFIPGVSPIEPCAIHREILVDGASGLRVAFDDGTRRLRREVYEFWPADLREVFAQAGLPRRIPPPFAPGTAAQTGENPLVQVRGRLRILSPRAGEVYELRLADKSPAGPPLRAQTEADATRVYWFEGRNFLGQSAPREPLSWSAKPGTWRLTAIDDLGRADTCSLTMQMAP
jgi:penicillin-binding protein 1C